MTDSVYKDTIQELPLFELVNIRTARKPERVEDYPFDSSVPYMDIKVLESGTPGRYAKDARFNIGSGDIVMVKDGYRSGKVFRVQEKGVAASTMAILSLKQDVVKMDYLYCYLAYCFDDLQKHMRGEVIGHLDMEYLKQLIVPLPCQARQTAIAEKYQRLESLANKTKEKSSRLKELSFKLGNSELKKESENLYWKVEMILKSWLHQIFDRTL